MNAEPNHPLLIAEERYKERAVSDFIDYCQRIRSEVWTLSRQQGLTDADIAFLNGPFVNEMEPLAKICTYEMGKLEEPVTVAHIDEQLADGRIRVGQNRVISVECTASKDFRRIVEGFELAKQGIFIPLTGARITQEEITHFRKGGTTDQWGEFDDEFGEKIANAVREVIDKKLKKPWPERENWLCVIIDDATTWYEDVAEQVVRSLAAEYQQRLAQKHIQKLWFMGYDEWIRCYEVLQD